MADLTIVDLPAYGVSLDDIIAGSMQAAAGGGDKFINNGQTLLLIWNGGGAGITVTVTSVADPEYGRTQNESITVSASELSIAGPFRNAGWNTKSGADKGKVAVTYSGVTSVKVLALRLAGL